MIFVLGSMSNASGCPSGTPRCMPDPCGVIASLCDRPMVEYGAASRSSVARVWLTRLPMAKSYNIVILVTYQYYGDQTQPHFEHHGCIFIFIRCFGVQCGAN